MPARNEESDRLKLPSLKNASRYLVSRLRQILSHTPDYATQEEMAEVEDFS